MPQTEEDVKTEDRETSGQEREPEITTPETGNLVKVKLGGKEFEVSAEQAEALKEHDKGFARKLSETSDELGRLRNLEREYIEKRYARTEVEKEEAEDDIEDLIIADPKKAVEKIESRILKKIESRQTEENLVKEQQKVFWNAFFVEHPELEKFEKHVKREFAANYNKYKSLPPTRDSRDIIARDVLEDFNDIREKFGQTKQTTLESVTHVPKEKTEKKQAEPKTISQILKEKRNRFGKAQL